MAKVAKTSGQGVSRKSYQAGRSLGNRGTATPGKGSSGSTEAKAPAASRGKGKIDSAAGMNISFGDLLPIGDLEAVKSYAKDKPAKSSVSLKQGKRKELK